jgi:hypothetical protein
MPDHNGWIIFDEFHDLPIGVDTYIKLKPLPGVIHSTATVKGNLFVGLIDPDSPLVESLKGWMTR